MNSTRISAKSLALICRSLSTLLHSGVALPKAFDVAANKSSDAHSRRVMQDVRDALKQGSDVASALRDHASAFPPLVIDMVQVAEQTGALPEILKGLADHYDNLVRLRRNFLRTIAWPVFQFVASVFIIALLIFVLGMIADSQGGEPFDVLGWGLTGATGALIWLTLVFGSLLTIFAVYKVVLTSKSGKESLHGLIMKIPKLSNCLRSFAVARFSWSFYLTQQAGMPIDQSLKAALNATANGTFLAAIPSVCKQIRSGEFLAKTLQSTRLFPEDYVHMVEVAETSGTVPEMLERLSSQFEEDAQRSLNTLAATAAVAVWVCVAAFVILLVFRVFFMYLNMINTTLQGL